MRRKSNSIALIGLLLFIGAFNSFYAQCYIVEDSIMSGDNAGKFSSYTYNADLSLVSVETSFQGNSMIDQIDSLFYDVGGEYIQLKTFFYNGANSQYDLATTTDFVYDMNGDIVRVEKMGTNSNGQWTMAHDISYNGNNQMENIILDQASITGQPEEFLASFINITWINGNATEVDLIGDFGTGTTDSLELIATYDTKNSLASGRFVEEAPDLIAFYSANNVIETVFENDESLGIAGSVAVSNSYSYYQDNVTIRTQIPALLDPSDRTIGYKWDCSLSVNSLDNSSSEIRLFPNPVYLEQLAQINFGKMIGSKQITIFNSLGQVVQQLTSSESAFSIDVSSLTAGIYTVHVQADNTTESIQMIKK